MTKITHKITNKTSIKVNNSYEGERVETKIERIVSNKEPIKDGAPEIYTERKHGVRPEFNIRTDRFEIAIDAMDKIQKTNMARRMEAMKPPEMKVAGGKDVGGTEPIQGTNNGQ